MNMLAIVSDAVWMQLIISMSGVLIASVGAGFAYAAKIHAERAKDLAENTNVAAVKTLKIVNGQSGVQLQISSKFARRVADLSKASGIEAWKEDEALAVEAERLYAEHMAQAKIESDKQEQKEAEDRAVAAGKV